MPYKGLNENFRRPVGFSNVFSEKKTDKLCPQSCKNINDQKLKFENQTFSEIFGNKNKFFKKNNDLSINDQTKQHIKLNFTENPTKKNANNLFAQTIDSRRFDEMSIAKQIGIKKRFTGERILTQESNDSLCLSTQRFKTYNYFSPKNRIHTIHDLDLKNTNFVDATKNQRETEKNDLMLFL